MNLTTLLEKCKINDREAQGQLYTMYKKQLFSLCLKYCKNFEEAEDTLQESFIAIFSKIDQYRGSGSFEAWMTRLTINKAINKYHKRTFYQEVKEDNITYPIVEIESVLPSLDEILGLVQELPNQYRLVFNLYSLDNYSHKEISKLLGISIGTSKSNLFRAKQILKAKLVEKEKLMKNYG